MDISGGAGKVAGSYSIDAMPTLTQPRLSVIVVCLNKIEVLQRCLAALAGQRSGVSMEILAVGRWNDGQDVAALRAHYPDIHWLAAPGAHTVPLMRTWGIRHSRGEIIALLEDDCVVAEGWCAEVIAAHQSDLVAIGGPVEPGNYQEYRDWGVYFCEYVRFMAPLSGVVPALPGNNVSYKRHILPNLQEQEGFYDVFFHWQLQQSGKSLFADSNLVVHNINHWPVFQLTAVPFHHGKAFAGMRAARFGAARRCLYFGLALGLPLLKTGRVAAEILGRKRYLRQFFLSAPWIFLFMICWSWGECCGYLAGAGDSADRWR